MLTASRLEEAMYFALHSSTEHSLTRADIVEIRVSTAQVQELSRDLIDEYGRCLTIVDYENYNTKLSFNGIPIIDRGEEQEHTPIEIIFRDGISSCYVTIPRELTTSIRRHATRNEVPFDSVDRWLTNIGSLDGELEKVGKQLFGNYSEPKQKYLETRKVNE